MHKNSQHMKSYYRIYNIDHMILINPIWNKAGFHVRGKVWLRQFKIRIITVLLTGNQFVLSFLPTWFEYEVIKRLALD